MNRRCGIFCTTCDCGRRRVPCIYRKDIKPVKTKWMQVGLVLAYAHTGVK